MISPSFPRFAVVWRRVLRAVHAFRTYQQGAVSTETVLILPVILWALVASVTYTDAFRQQTNLQKSVFTASDLLSRAGGTVVTPEYIDGIFGFMQRMNESQSIIQMRVSLVAWDSENDQLRVVWSNASHAGDRGLLRDDDLNAVYAPQIPSVAAGETVLLTEGWLRHVPLFDVGLTERVFDELAVTRPRFAPGIVYDDPNAPPPPAGWCDFVVESCEM
ncbi:hypothetical protein LY56_01270 [Roseinatronobacter thiooxidans]|uniref:Flp pilus assembly protein TadG n=1 Tax=Roseinatronobacter thiooxidans TaxID=121821 RepID=A0A2W7QR06_9RHOB|nr:hypothetical protein [Roseinatronobacter thiooxidans]PZX46297.1 hypothetical protein LY56_01270 [Roseinatronobacter thiooxidans]